MSENVEFDSDKVEYARPGASAGYSSRNLTGINASEPKMVQWLMRHGFTDSPGGANRILIVVVIINIIITYLVISYLL